MSATKRSWLDRMMQATQPKVVSSYNPAPQQLAEGLWVIERRLTMPGGPQLPARMTVVCLQSGGLFLHSPTKLDADLQQWLGDRGRVEAIVAPNSFHFLFASAYLEAFPSAQFFVAPGLPARVPTLPPATELGNVAPTLWAAEMEQAVFGPVRGLAEVIFFHRPTKTLLLTDLAFNMTADDSLFNRLCWRVLGVPARFGPSRSARMTLLRDKAAARTYLQPVLAWPFQRILVTHGLTVENDAQAEFRRAYATYL
ncbi:MAG: DUF4336 domain-containing protein [Candidatus Binatia bacterium]